MRKIVRALILMPLVLVLVLFAVANRQVVTLSFDPFDSVDPAYALKFPLFILFFVLIAAGVVIGGICVWFGQHAWRVRARQAEAEAQRLRRELAERNWPPLEPRALPAAREEPAAPLVFPPAA
jgi:uncharacterized membrane protein YciS (DUF1049 family)